MRRAGWIFCILLMPEIATAGMTGAARKSEFEKALNVIMATSIPKLPPANRERMIKSYIDARGNKAQAAELDSNETWRSTEHEDPGVTGDRTLEGCQLRYEKPCALIAVNYEIVVDGPLIVRDMPRLRYAGKFDIDQILIIRATARNRADVQNYTLTEEPKAVAIHPWGRIFIASGTATFGGAEAAALERCNNDPSRKGLDGGCFLYATNNQVVISKRFMKATAALEPR